MLLTGGVHGDEYKGQIALHELARTLDPAAVQGRVIIIPALHFPAAQAGTRLSPIDNRDINRSFPGDADGSFALMLAHYVSAVLLPLCDAVSDLHSGGRSLDCLPCTMSHILDDVAFTRRTIELACAFGAPYHVVSNEVDGAATFQSTAERLGILSMSSELGGGNRVQLPDSRSPSAACATSSSISASSTVSPTMAACNQTRSPSGRPWICYGFSPCTSTSTSVPRARRPRRGGPAGGGHLCDRGSRRGRRQSCTTNAPACCGRRAAKGACSRGDSAAVVVTNRIEFTAEPLVSVRRWEEHHDCRRP